jgi:hypothetical protein
MYLHTPLVLIKVNNNIETTLRKKYFMLNIYNSISKVSPVIQFQSTRLR